MNLTASSLVKGFDETTYLARNPDVAQAVADGNFASGLEHLLLFGLGEGRAGVPQRLTTLMQSSVDSTGSPRPVPPEHLRTRVHGDDSLERFEFAGKLLAYEMYSAISALSKDNAPRRVLDFGSGCGRVLTYISELATNSDFSGTDIDSEAIGWCATNLDHLARFATNDDAPPTGFATDAFDFVYSISVFTHLPEDMQFEWLAEIARLVSPGGYALLTVHGEDLAVGSKSQARTLAKDGFLYSVGPGTSGLPGYYQTTYHSPEYIMDRWSQFFDIETIISQGVMSHQDLVVCRVPMENAE